MVGILKMEDAGKVSCGVTTSTTENAQFEHSFEGWQGVIRVDALPNMGVETRSPSSESDNWHTEDNPRLPHHIS